MALLNATNVHKTYRLGKVDVPVLRGVSVTVEPGEFVAILGSSGSGKSTLLHILGGLDRPDAGKGEVVFDGTPLSAMGMGGLDRYRSERVGFVFQFYHLLPELTVMENVTVAAMIRQGRLRYKAAEVTERAKALLESFGLGHRLGHRPAELSGGERQRTAIARALINRPAVLLADEPTGNLDRVTGGTILDALAGHRASEKLATVMVTHDQEVAARADRVVRLVDGRLA
ncbi:MAG: ABC transporter ATP-binding protein [Planctomycetaceae bacterium]|jgi:lipoprotein-releasing system ATP-binding protein|nr:ABC transporter ATP-binding protein [Phycisphaerales bacterium]MCE2653962.1 ABC transporter ATP-binding protein [Planctomycetaceae bacterium]